MIRRSTVLLLLSAIGSASVSATGLSEKYKSWDKSSEAYFLTAEERAKWKRVHSDADAENFVADYFARRSLDFPSLLKERIAVADKYFSAGKIKGSETLQGKVIIVFGPPSKINFSGPRDSAGRPGGDRGDLQYANAGESDPHTKVGPGGSALVHSLEEPVLSLLYDRAAAPNPIGKAFRVDLKMKSSARQEAVNPRELEEYFEKMAQASLSRPANP